MKKESCRQLSIGLLATQRVGWTIGLAATLVLHGIAAPAAEAPDADLPWTATIASDEEPGEPLTIAGTVHAADGKTPLPGVRLYVYHTDRAGLYGRDSRSSDNPRLHAWLRTNAEGRFEFHTIKPGPYPAGGAAAHIHFVLALQEFDESDFEIFFEGDEYLSDETRDLAARGRAQILTLRKDDEGRLRGGCDITYRDVPPPAARAKR